MAIDLNLKLFKFDIVDDRRLAITTGATVTIENSGVAETIYSDQYKTSKSNPITGTIVGGIIEFYSYKSEVDVHIVTPDGTSRHNSVTISTARLVVITHLESQGTTSETFQIDSDNSGPKLKNTGGTLCIRNAADDAYAPIMASVVTGTSAVFTSSLTGTTLNAGADGSAGVVVAYPATAAKGTVTLSATDSAGDTDTEITNASQAGARTYTIPDAGASAEFLMGLGDQLVGGEKTFTEGAAVAVCTMRFGATATEGLELCVLDEIVTLTNAVETDLTSTVPAGAVIISSQGNLESAVTGDGTGDNLLAKVGIGVTADANKYGLSADLNQNTKIDSIPDWVVLGGEETVTVKAAKANGTFCTEKFTAGGTVRVRIVYLAHNSLDDA